MPSKTPALVIRCQKHPTYTGLNKPRVECEECEFLHEYRGAGILLPWRYPHYLERKGKAKVGAQ